MEEIRVQESIDLMDEPVPEFTLPGLARDLVSRVVQDLINPCRRGFSNAEQVHKEALAKAQETLDRARSQCESLKNAHQAQLRDLETKLAAANAELDTINEHADTHMTSQSGERAIGDGHVQSATKPTGSPPVLDAQALTQAIQHLKAQLEIFQQWSRPSYWPPDVGARWVIAGSCLLLFFVFYPLVLAWPAIVYLGRSLSLKKGTAQYYALLESIRQIKQSLTAQLLNAVDECHTSIATAERSLPPASQQHAAAGREANQVLQGSVQKIRQEAAKTGSLLHEEIARLWLVSSCAGADWDSPLWQDWSPDSSPQFAARIGTLTIAAIDLEARFPELSFSFKLPALVPFADGRCLLLNATGRGKQEAAEALQSVLIRALASTPPGKARFTFIDPIGLGQNVASFMHLGDYDEKLIHGKAWTEPQHIDQQLTGLTEHMETVIQKYLRKDFASIQDFNEKACEVAEAFRFLVVFDFPANFSDLSARRLVSIVRNGPRCGVYTFIMRDTSRPLPHGFNLSDLEQSAVIVAWEGSDSALTPTWKSDEFAMGKFEPDALDGHDDLVNRIIGLSGELAVRAMKVEVPFDTLFGTARLADSWLQNSTARSLKVALGPSGARKVQYLTLGEGLAHHGLIVGRTGSGKTNLMHVIIAGLALSYSPREVKLYLVDFKGGVGFKPYADHGLPHAAVIAIESEREFGMSVLQGLDSELQRRFEVFRATGVDNLTDFRSRSSEEMPRIVLIVDEFQEFFATDDAVATDSKMIFDRIVRQGRSFGLHIILGTQSLSGSAQLPTSTVGQMAVRIALPCSEADCRMILADGNLAARSLSRPGEAIYNPSAGLVEGNSPFQAAKLADNDLHRYLQAVSAQAAEARIHSHPIVFEGNEPAALECCKPLLSLLESGAWPQPPTAPVAWLGEPVAILPPASAAFLRQTGKHLLIVCREEAAGVGALYAAWLSLLCQWRPMTAQFFMYDLATPDSPWAAYSAEVRSHFKHQIETLNRRNLPEVLSSLASTVKRRLESPSRGGAPSYLLIHGLQRARDLRMSEESFFGGGSSEPTLAEVLGGLLRDGPEVGVHVLTWCDTVSNARRSLGRALGEFGMRLAGPMSVEDSNAFLDCSDASRLDKPHRLLLYDDEKPGFIQRLRPYSLASLEWLRSVASQQRSWPHE